MLPDFPDLKSKIHNLFSINLENEKSEFNGMYVPRHKLHEGSFVKLFFEENRKEEIVLLEKFEGKAQFEVNEIELLSLKEVYDRLRVPILQVAKEENDYTIKEIEKAAEEVGNTLQLQSPSPEAFFKVIEKIEMNFDQDKNPIFPTIIINPEASNIWQSVLKKLDEEPSKAKFQQLIARKKQEWHARENCRKLVD